MLPLSLHWVAVCMSVCGWVCVTLKKWFELKQSLLSVFVLVLLSLGSCAVKIVDRKETCSFSHIYICTFVFLILLGGFSSFHPEHRWTYKHIVFVSALRDHSWNHKKPHYYCDLDDATEKLSSLSPYNWFPSVWLSSLATYLIQIIFLPLPASITADCKWSIYKIPTSLQNINPSSAI